MILTIKDLLKIVIYDIDKMIFCIVVFIGLKFTNLYFDFYLLMK